MENTGSQKDLDMHKKVRKPFWGIVIGALVVIILILLVGLSFERHNRAGFGYGPGMMGGAYAKPHGAYGMMGERGYQQGGWAHQGTFGVITAISGNKITITNNAGKSEDIYSQATTMITNNSGAEISLAALKTGQSIVITGSTDANNQLQAQTIAVQ